MENFIEMEVIMEINLFFQLMRMLVKLEKFLESFLYQFYADKDVPPKILVNIDEEPFKEVEKTLNKKNKSKTKILKPKSGEKLTTYITCRKKRSWRVLS